MSSESITSCSVSLSSTSMASAKSSGHLRFVSTHLWWDLYGHSMQADRSKGLS